MKKFTTVLICFMLLLNLKMSGQYLETFGIPNKGILMGSCSGPDGTTCASYNFTGIDWTIEGDLSGIDATPSEAFATNASGVLSVNDLDGEACWVSPLLNIDIGTPVSINADLTWIGYDLDDDDSADYIDLEYKIDNGNWEQVPNAVGGSIHTIGYEPPIIGSGTDGNATVTATNLTGSTLQIRVCTRQTSSAEVTTIDNISVMEAGVTILPIELLSFGAKQLDNRHIQLTWQTATEINNNYINIQRSADGLHFTTIGKVTGHGTTDQPRQYRYVDQNPLIGTNYYRLQQVDFDGQSTLHHVISVDFNSKESIDIQLSPNPAKDILQITLDRELAEAAQFAIFDSHGTLIQQEAWPEEKRTQSLALSQWPSGIYYVQMIAGNTLYNRKFVKQ